MEPLPPWQELHTFLEVFAIRLESQEARRSQVFRNPRAAFDSLEAALSDAAKEIRKSSESVSGQPMRCQLAMG